MAAWTSSGSIVKIALGVAVVGFVVYTAQADGDEHVGQVAPAKRAAKERMPERPDIILITVDTLRADRLGVYGYEDAYTPTLDELGRSGVVFANATVPLPRTTPGLASLLTGQSPQEHGSREVWQPISVERGDRMAEVLSDAGYATFGLSANAAAGSRQGLAVGFDDFLDTREIKKKYKRDDADVVTDAALEMIDDLDGETPLFLWVHYVDPHWRYAPPKKHFREQPKAAKCRTLQKQVKSDSLTLGNVISNASGVASRALEDCSALYDAEISFVDQEIGRLIEGLRERERWDDSLVAFTADHGENMGEDGLYFAHGPSLADASLRVPLILAGPTIPSGAYDGGVATIEDVMPTLLDLAGIERDLWPELTTDSMQWRWDDTLDYPKTVRSAALAEAGGALHPDNANGYVVSGRARSKYCYNGPRYSMCYEAEKKATNRVPVRTSGGAGAGAGGDAPDMESPEDHDDPMAPEQNEQLGAVRTSSSYGSGSSAKELEYEFYDRQADPKLAQAIESIPEEARKQLLSAKRRWSPESTRSRAVRDTQYKLVAYPKLEGGYRYALYDLRADPMEAEDLASVRPKEFKRMKAMLDDYNASIPTFVARERSESELEELRALGYVQ